MKKLLLTTLILTAFSCSGTNASTVIVDYQGPTLVHQQTVERNLVVNSNDDGNYNIAIKPLSETLMSSDGKVSIPLSNLYINNTREDIYLRYNDYSILFNSLEMNGIPRQITAKIRGFGVVPAGVYNMPLEIQSTDINTGTITSTNSFNLQFIVPASQQMTVSNKTPIINITSNEIGSNVGKIVAQSAPMIYVNSNTDWVLYLNTDNFERTKTNYYVRTVSASSGINERLQERVLMEQGKEIILAKGKAPANNEYVTLEYSVENDSKNIIRAGKYESRVRLVLREDKG